MTRYLCFPRLRSPVSHLVTFGIVVASAVVLIANAAAARDVSARNRDLLDRLVAAYPDVFSGHDGNAVIWKDGTKMPFDDGRTGKDFDTLLNHPDIEDQFYAPYETGDKGLAPGRDIDPGRVRFEPMFRKMYGDCREGSVKKRLKRIAWLPRHGGGSVMVTSQNGVDRKLAAVSRDLDALLDRQPKLRRFLIPSAGTYNCRLIAGTKRYSVHAFGAAIDISTKAADYWRWVKPGKSGLYEWRNRIPLEIVDAFERHGFIWGGKWYHYDTMHFEYRPELLPAATTVSMGKPKPN